jgi:hypothetical protein
MDDNRLRHLLEERETSLSNTGSNTLIKRVKQRLHNSLPGIFLSYPTSAQLHANLLRDRFKESYQIYEVQNPVGKDILEEVIDKIQ